MLWDSKTFNVIKSMKVSDFENFCNSEDNLSFFITTKDELTTVWNAEELIKKGPLKRKVGGVWSAEYSPDRQRFVTVSFDKAVTEWDSKTLCELGTYNTILALKS